MIKIKHKNPFYGSKQGQKSSCFYGTEYLYILKEKHIYVAYVILKE